VNEEFDKDAELTAVLFGELSPEAAEALAAGNAEELAELRGVLAALRADLPDEVAPLSEACREAVLAVAAELDATLAVLPAAEPPPVIETHWLRRQLPMILAALVMLGAGVGSMILINTAPKNEIASLRSAGPPAAAAEFAGEALEPLPVPLDSERIALVKEDAEASGAPGNLALNLAAAEIITVAAEGSAERGIAVTAEASALDTAAPAAFADVAADLGLEEDLDDPFEAFASAKKPDRRASRARARMGARESVGDLAFSAVDEEPESRAHAVAPPTSAKPAAAMVQSFAAASVPEAPPVAEEVADAFEIRPLPGNGPKVVPPAVTALRAQTVQVEYAPSPLHPDRLLLVVQAPGADIRFDAALVQSHRQLAPGVYEVTLQAGSKRGAFATVVLGEVSVPVPIEGGKAAFDQTSVAYRMAVLKALDIQEVTPARAQPE
jgi:hypothetical protein